MGMQIFSLALVLVYLLEPVAPLFQLVTDGQSESGLDNDASCAKDEQACRRTSSGTMEKPIQSDAEDIEATLRSVGFLNGLVSSLLVVVVSELGDKTFCIAAILAMKQALMPIYLGAMVANTLTTALSGMLGYAVTFVPSWIIRIISSALFAIFGLKTMREGFLMTPDDDDEMEEAVEDIQKQEEKMKEKRVNVPTFSRVFIQAFSLTFLAEWGDRSQISTVMLAATNEVIGVTLGGILGNGLCTGLAVLGGKMLAEKISARTVHLIGGLVFVVLSAATILPED